MGSSWSATPTPAEIWAASARTLTDFSAEELFDLPSYTSGYPATALTSSATAHTFGAWVEIAADVGVGKRLIGIVVAFTDTNASAWEIELGEGGGGSEAAVALMSGTFVFASAVGEQPGIFYPIWKSLSDNARLSARVKDTEAAGRGFRVVALIA